MRPSHFRALSLAVLVSLLTTGVALAMDQDGDTDVDTDDINIILAARGLPATGATDPRDLDSDGTITVLDARIAVLSCTRPLCAVGNNPPTISAIADQATNEDTATGPIAFIVGDPDIGTDPATLMVSATSSDPTLLPDGNITFGGAGANRTIDLLPALDGNGGPVTITVTVDDGATADNTATTAFSLTVTSVNDAPTIDAVADPAAIGESSGQQTVNLAGIGAGAANETQVLTVTATSSNTSLIPNPTVVYTSPNATGSLQYTPVPGESGTALITLTVMDDGGTANGGSDTTVETFTVTVNVVNDQPTLDAIADPAAILEDAAQQSVNLTGIGTGAANETQTLSVTAASSNPGLVPNPTVTYTSPDATGSLQYTPLADQFGSAVITVTVMDDGGTANGGIDTVTQMFTVNVTAVNDAPTLDAISNPAAIDEDSAQQTVSLTGISAGGGESQTLTVTATSSNPGLISNPTVTYASPGTNGMLEYSPVANQSGTATVTVTVMDDGGTANGGIDVSMRTFVVTVSAVNDQPMITSSATPIAAENQTLAVDVMAVDPDGETESGGGLTYSLTGGADMALFSIDDAGLLTFDVAPDFENPLDTDTNNLYDVQVTVTDVGLLTDTQNVAVTVAAVNEAPLLATGALQFVEAQFDGVGGVDGLDLGQGITVSPDGLHVYAASRNDNAVAVFSRDSNTGALTFVEFQEDGVGGVDGLDGASTPSVSPDGRHVYVAARNDNAVSVFSRNPATGALTFVEIQQDGVGGVDGLANATFVTLSSDGRHVYVAASADNAVAVFSRDWNTGALTFVEFQQDGVGGVDGLGLATTTAVSSDGRHVYVSSSFDNAVAVFSRNSATGALTFVELQQDGVGSVDGLGGGSGVAVSPDGQHVVTAGATDNAITVFSRDATTGALTFVEFHQDGVGGVDGLADVRSVSFDPSGRNVYATSSADSAVAVFSRSASGTLTFLEIQQDGLSGVDGLESANFGTVSAEGRHLYAVSSGTDNAVAVFSRQARSVPIVAPGPVDLFESTSDFSVTDPDSPTLASATVNITNVQDAGMELLAATPSGGILAGDISYIEPTLTIAPVTPQSLADFEAVLRSVTYDNTAANPDPTTRLITTVANDGAAVGPLDSNTFTVMVGLNTAPTAEDDSYTGQPVNVLLDAGATDVTAFAQVEDPDGVLDKGTADSDPENDPLTVTMVQATAVPDGGSATAITTGGGSVTMNSDGTFSYISQVAETAATDTFTYEIADPAGLTDTATVTITFGSDTIWFIDDLGGTGGTGLSNDPFLTIGDFNTATTSPGDTVFLHAGTYTDDGVDLLDNQILIGEAGGLVSGNLTIAAGSAPSVAPATDNGVNLQSGNTIRGLDIGNTPQGHGLFGGAVGTLTVGNNVNVTGTGGILRVITSGTLDNVTLGTQTSTSTPAGTAAIQLVGVTNGYSGGAPTIDGSSAAGIDISGSTGTFTFDAGTSIGATNSTAGPGVDVSGGSASLNFSGSLTKSNAGAAIVVDSGHSTGTLTFSSGTISATGGTGLQFDNADGIYSFSGTTTLNGGDAGIDILNGSTGTFTFGGNSSITNPSGIGFNVDTSSGGNVTYNGTISQTNAQNAVRINAKTAGTVDFNGAVTASTGSARGINLTSNPGATIRFDGGLDIDTTSGVGFFALGGTIIVSDTGGDESINTSAGKGIELDTIFANIDFDTVTVVNSGTNQGIDIANTNGTVDLGGGSLLHTGPGTGIDIGDTGNGSGGAANITYLGSITSPSGRGIGIQNRDGGTVILGGTLNIMGTGIILNGNNDGPNAIVISGATKTVNTGPSPAITLNANTGATIDFSNGGLDIDTTSGTAFNATGGGIVRVLGNGNTINTGTGSAITITSTTIGNALGGPPFLNTANGTFSGPFGMTFQSVSVNGATQGIVITNAGSGGFEITGTGTTDGSGGLIQSTSQDGVEITNTTNVQLRNLNLTRNAQSSSGTSSSVFGGDIANYFAALKLSSVDNLVLNNLNIDGGEAGGGVNNNVGETGISGQTVSDFFATDVTVDNFGNAGTEDNVQFQGLTGAVGLTNFTSRDSAGSLLAIENTSGSLTMRVDNGLFAETVNGVGRGGLEIDLSGSGTTALTVVGSTFGNGIRPLVNGGLQGTGINFDVGGTHVGSLTVQDSSFNGVNAGITGSLDIGGINPDPELTVRLEDGPDGDLVGNTVTRVRAVGINLFTNGNLPPGRGQVNATITDNVVGTFGESLSGAEVGSGIRVQNEGGGSMTALLDGNTVQEVGDSAPGIQNGFEGIIVSESVSSGSSNITITNNTLRNIHDDRAIQVTQPSAAGSLCSNIANNSFSGTIDTDNPINALTRVIRVRETTGSHTAVQTSQANLAAVNGLASGNITVSGAVAFGGATCSTPP